MKCVHWKIYIQGIECNCDIKNENSIHIFNLNIVFKERQLFSHTYLDSMPVLCMSQSASCRWLCSSILNTNIYFYQNIKIYILGNYFCYLMILQSYKAKAGHWATFVYQSVSVKTFVFPNASRGGVIFSTFFYRVVHFTRQWGPTAQLCKKGGGNRTLHRCSLLLKSVQY